MNLNFVKSWDKNSKKYKFAKRLYTVFLFYFINIEHLGGTKKIQKMIGGQHFDIELVDSMISPKDGVVIDVGAERGDIATHFYSDGFKVYAIEPEKKNFAFLWLHNCFKILFGRFKIYRLACGENPTTAKLNVSTLAYRHSFGELDQNYSEGETQTVQVVRVGDFIKMHKIKSIALLKVDAEGFDLEVLKGLFNSTPVLPKVIMFEADHDKVKQLVELAQSNGYKYFRFICRWEELPNLSGQKRIASYDGIVPEVFTTGGNVICSKECNFRVAYPLIV